VSADGLHEHAPELKRYVDNQPVFVAAEIKDHPVVAHEIDVAAELPLYLGWTRPLCFGGNREPRPDRSLRMRVTRPEFLRSTPEQATDRVRVRFTATVR
jgi:hypothetical protein